MAAKTALFALPLLAVAPRPADEVVLAPDEGAVVEKTFRFSLEGELDDVSLAFGGTDVSSELGDVEASFELEQTVGVTDEYAAVSGGRATRLVRTFDELVGRVAGEAYLEMADEEPSGEEDMESELEGRTVVFTWDEDDGAYRASWPAGEDGDDALLEGLEQDMDLAVLLPPGEVEAGDTWEVDLEALGDVLGPGGDLGLEAEEEPEEVDAELEERLEELFREALSGTATCTYRGVREEDGVQVAAIGVEVSIDTTTDIAELIEAAIEVEDAEVRIEAADVTMEVEAAGLLLWHVEAGRFHHFELSGDVTLGLDVEVASDEVDGEVSVEASADLEVTADAE